MENSLKEQQTGRIAVDDLVVGTRMTVLLNRWESDYPQMPFLHAYLKGTVLEVVAISLPYVLVSSFEAGSPKATISIDVREHQFIAVGDDYADAVIQSSESPLPQEAQQQEVPF